MRGTFFVLSEMSVAPRRLKEVSRVAAALSEAYRQWTSQCRTVQCDTAAICPRAARSSPCSAAVASGLASLLALPFAAACDAASDDPSNRNDPKDPTEPSSSYSASSASSSSSAPSSSSASSSSSSYGTAKWRIYTDRAFRAASATPPDHPSATHLLRTALSHAIAGFGPDDPHVAAAKQNLAEVLRISATAASDPRLEEALGLYKEALGILVSAYGYADARVGALLHNMAGVYVRMEDWGEAQRCYEEAVDVKRRVHGAGHRDVELSERHLEKVKAKANVKGKVKFKRREKEECDGG